MREKGSFPRHEDCWAKTKADGRPGINVLDHCLNVGCVAEALVAILPGLLQGLVPQGAASLAALHDVGKVSPGFQVKCERWLTEQALTDCARREGWGQRESDHAKISQSTVQNLLGAPTLSRWAAAVGAHHGRIKGERITVHEPWEQERVRLAGELITNFGPLPDRPADDAAIWLVAGLITVADWIGSDELHFGQDARWDMAERRRQSQESLARIHWRPVRTRQLHGFAELFPEIERPNGLQDATLEVVRERGVYVIEGPMGYGKTAAALAAAYQLLASGNAAGLYFALPTQVTSNRIHLQVQPFVERIATDSTSVRLAHGASWLVEKEPPVQLRPASPDGEAREHVQAAHAWFASAKRALLLPFGVGTIDQALLGVVAAKHFFVRQFGLAGKVVVLDEVHTYDFYTGTLLSVLVKRLRELNSTVIILSATLTEKRRRELLGVSDRQPLSAAYPVVSGMGSSFIEKECEPPSSKRFRVRGIAGTLPLAEALDRARRGECVLWIRNTIDDAQATYGALRDSLPAGGPSIALLHSRFPFFRREELENDWIERLGKGSPRRPMGCILVSTQVVEQSVDIDADLLITDLAPTDMLLQRLGRLWRHERPSRPCAEPEVWIRMPGLDPDELRRGSKKELRDALGNSARVYAPYVLLRSLVQWRGRTALTLPDDIRKILDATYADPPADEPSGWQELRHELERDKEKMGQLALSAADVWNNPALIDDEGVQTRYTTYPAAQLLLVRQIDRSKAGTTRLQTLSGEMVTVSDGEWSFGAAKAIYRNLTRVPRWAAAAGLREAPRWLASYASQSTAAGVVQADGAIYWTGTKTPAGLTYDHNRGVTIDRKNAGRPENEDSNESYD